MNKPAFVCAVWNCPISDMDKWIARGCNTLIGCGLTGADTPDTRREWATAARGKLLWTIYDPQTGPVLDNQMAFMLPDEMDAKQSAWKPPKDEWNGWPREKIRPLYDAFKARVPTMPVFMSCAGDHVTQANRLAYYQSIADSSDIWMEDGYPRNTNAVTRTEALWPGQAVQVLKAAALNKPRWAMLECGFQNLKDSPNGRAPTAAEVSSAFDIALANGASGIGVFSHHFNGNGGWVGWDNTPADIAAVITDRFKKLNPPAPSPTIEQRVAALETIVKGQSETIAAIVQRNTIAGNALAGKASFGTRQ